MNRGKIARLAVLLVIVAVLSSGRSSATIDQAPSAAPGPVTTGATEAPSPPVPIAAPPDSVFERFMEGDREVARKFYSKYA
ncbi:MAG TPA: hypothetical protein VL371_18670, partial [Gemmataceae bacterium]|nr:hypothetical protein [Gemmataceae bacterium]